MEIYLKTQDQRQLKQLYQKVLPLTLDKMQQFKVQIKFMRYLSTNESGNEKQNMIIWKKCMQLAQQIEGEDPFQVCYMIVCMAGQLSIMGQIESFDKSEPIKALNALILKTLSSFINKVLKNKGNLNSNEYLMKTDTYIGLLYQVFAALRNFHQLMKGRWKC